MDGQQIFSIGGSPSFRINRRRQTASNVFPFGCMGNNQQNLDLPSPTDAVIASDVEENIVKESEKIVKLPEPIEEITSRKPKRMMAPYQGLSARNPLTGEGIELPDPNKGRRGSMRRAPHTKWCW